MCSLSPRVVSEVLSLLSAFCPAVPPRWMIEPQDTSVLKGKTGLIDCQADGFPPPSVRWSKTDGEFCLCVCICTCGWGCGCGWGCECGCVCVILHWPLNAVASFGPWECMCVCSCCLDNQIKEVRARTSRVKVDTWLTWAMAISPQSSLFLLLHPLFSSLILLVVALVLIPSLSLLLSLSLNSACDFHLQLTLNWHSLLSLETALKIKSTFPSPPPLNLARVMLLLEPLLLYLYCCSVSLLRFTPNCKDAVLLERQVKKIYQPCNCQNSYSNFHMTCNYSNRLSLEWTWKQKCKRQRMRVDLSK